MNRIDRLFQEKKQNVLTIYFTAGYPELNDTARIIEELAAAGTDCIEIGMPYSDPLADGETIQHSSSIALKNGMHLDLLFEQLSDIRDKTQVPLILMGYLNQLVQYGLEKFCSRAKDCGIDGLIIPDMPLYNFENEYREVIESYGLHSTFLVTPRTPDERIRKIDSLSSGFLYVVSDSSITGKQKGISDKQTAYFEKLNSMNLSNPLQVGFGISKKEDFDAVCKYAQGAIVGSAFIRHLATGESIESFVKGLKG